MAPLSPCNCAGIRQATVKTGNADLFPKITIPDSTRRSWLRRGVADLLRLDVRDAETIELHADVAKLEQRLAVLTAVVCFALASIVNPKTILRW